MIKVIVADDHHLVRQGLRALLENTREVEVVGEAGTGYEAVDQVEKLQPDVIVMDLSMPMLDGVQLAPVERVVNTFLGIYGILALITIIGAALITRLLVTLTFRSLGQVETTEFQ